MKDSCDYTLFGFTLILDSSKDFGIVSQSEVRREHCYGIAWPVANLFSYFPLFKMKYAHGLMNLIFSESKFRGKQRTMPGESSANVHYERKRSFPRHRYSLLILLV